MENRRSILTFLALFSSIFLSFAANANLLIAPTRITFGERERSDTVTLVNPGQKTVTYRLSWVTNVAQKDGSYVTLQDGEASPVNSAADFIRISPRQVTLKPNERQTIKLLVRRPRELADGEYRSHLMFTALPDKRDTENASQGMQVKLDLLLSYSIPVIVRQGKLDAIAEIEDANITYGNNNNVFIHVDLARSGASSTQGNLNAYWQEDGSDHEIKIGMLNGVACYPELNERSAEIIWQDFQQSYRKGRLRIVYEGQGEFHGKIFDELTKQLDFTQS